jgi:hypothetical protein
MIHGSGIPDDVSSTVGDEAIDALCGTRDAVSAMGVTLDQVLLVMREIRGLLAENISKGDEVTARLEAAAETLRGEGNALSEVMRARPERSEGPAV